MAKPLESSDGAPKVHGGRVLVVPGVIPPTIAARLAASELSGTDDIHKAIMSGTLEDFHGIGPATAHRIRALFTAAKPGSGWGGPRKNSGRRKMKGRTIEARISTTQAAKLERLRRKWGLTTSAVVRRMIDSQDE